MAEQVKTSSPAQVKQPVAPKVVAKPVFQAPPKLNIVLGDENSFFSNVKDAVLVEFLNYLKKYSKFFTKKWNGNFNSVEAMNKFVRESIVSFLNEEFVDYSARISEFRKKGYDTDEISLKLMAVPLKIKLVNVEWKINDMNKIFVVFGVVKNILDNYEVLDKKKEEEKKLKEMQEDAARKKAEADKAAANQKVTAPVKKVVPAKSVPNQVAKAVVKVPAQSPVVVQKNVVSKPMVSQPVAKQAALNLQAKK